MTQAPASAGLPRTMHGFGALMITLSCLSPSIGVFIVGSDVIRQAGTGSLPVSSPRAFGVLMACIYAELVSAFPDTGGEYTLIGLTVGPTAGFAVLGLLLTGFTVGEALSSRGIATYLRVIVPGLQATPTALTVSILVTLVAVLNIRINALVTGIFLSLEVLSLVVLTVLGFAQPPSRPLGHHPPCRPGRRPEACTHRSGGDGDGGGGGDLRLQWLWGRRLDRRGAA